MNRIYDSSTSTRNTVCTVVTNSGRNQAVGFGQPCWNISLPGLVVAQQQAKAKISRRDNTILNHSSAFDHPSG